MTRPKMKILVDGGDPQETRRVKELLGFVDGQTTNPTLIAKNPHIKELIASGHKLSSREEMDEYIDLEQAWERFDIRHELTRKGIEKFAADYRATLSRSA